MGTDYNSVLLYGIKVTKEEIDSIDTNEDFYDLIYKTKDVLVVERDGDYSKKWTGLDDGLVIHQASYSYDEIGDVYFCCAYFETDCYSSTFISDMPVIGSKKSTQIKERLLAAIKEKLGIVPSFPEARWYLMVDSS